MKTRSQIRPQEVADWLYAQDVTALTPQQRADLYNACGAWLARCRELLRGMADAKAKS